MLDGAQGVRYVPDVHSGVGVLTVAGSSGRVDSDRARLFAEHGALAESVRWFGGPGQSPGPWDVPLELFSARVDELARECDRVIVVGTSFGAEAALLTGVGSASVSTVVAFAPSDVVWAGVAADGRMTSHWTAEGRPVPFVPFIEDWEPDQDPPSYLDLYRRCREEQPDAVAAAAIAVERISEVILVAGGHDLLWPSVQQAQCIRARRSAHGVDTTVLTDAEAGHRTVLPGEPVVRGGARMARGGTEVADRRLGELAWSHLRPLLAGRNGQR